MTDPADDHPIERVLNHGEAAVSAMRRFFAGYFWLILKNVVGWLLIILALPLGMTVPGPGGLPTFLLGFALVAFPGKRKLTSHFLRGRPLRIEASIFTSLTTVASLAAIGVLLWFVGERYQQLIQYFKLDPERSTPGFIAAVAGLCVIATLVTWGVMRLLLLLTNRLIRLVPRIRRLIRPYMRKWGIVLLPPPKSGGRQSGARESTEILELSATSRARFARGWARSRPWVRRFLGLGVTAVLLYCVIEPIIRGWREAERHINQISPAQFVIAVIMGAGVLFLFRALIWWVLLGVLGHHLSGASTTRIWVISELARYLPGASWQVISRSFLLRPYNVPESVVATSNVLESVLFTLANVLFAILFLLLLGMSRVQGESARGWLIVGASALPLALGLLHRRIFYSIINRFRLALSRPRVQTTVRGGTLTAMLLWKIGGLALMSLAMWLIASEPLDLPLSKWWLVGGIYAIAWLAGEAAFWAPGGIGVREAVFMWLLMLALPNQLKQHFTPDALAALAALLALILRVWTVIAEMIVAIGGHVFDLDGALAAFRGKRPD